MKPNPSADRRAYIPPSIEKAMSANLPAHLQQYVGDNRPSYVPPQVQKELNQRLQMMPTHLKQYSGAFMQQRVMQPNFSPKPISPNRTATNLPSRPPTPNPLRIGQSLVAGEQPTAKINIMGQNQTPPNQNTPTGSDYSFMFSPEQPQKTSPFDFLKSGNSKVKKLAVIAGGGVALIILIVVFSSLFLGSNANTTALISLAQKQNEIVRVATEATNEAINQNVKNLAVNTQLSVTTDQEQILAYLSQKHTKVSTKQLAMTKNATTDQQLSQAQSDSTFDTVYVQITQNALNSYLQSLQQTLNSTTDQTLRQILAEEKSNATILAGEVSSVAQSLGG